MVRTQISFEEALFKDAKAEARRLGISLAELCRRSVRQAVAGRGAPKEKPWMRYSGAIRGGRPDESTKQNVDRTVYGSQTKG